MAFSCGNPVKFVRSYLATVNVATNIFLYTQKELSTEQKKNLESLTILIPLLATL